MELFFIFQIVHCQSVDIQLIFATLYPPNQISLVLILLVLIVDSLRFLIYQIMESVNRDRFTFSISTWVSGLIVLVRTSSAMLSRSGKSGLPCFISDLRVKSSNVSPLSGISAVNVSYMSFIRLRKSLHISSSWRVFICKECCLLLNDFSASIEIILWVFFL